MLSVDLSRNLPEAIASPVISVAARSSALSQAQVEEVYREIRRHHSSVQFHPIYLKTTGDCDLTTSLRTMEKTDFFTKEIDALQTAGGCRISIHSAKDLPEPLAVGLCIVALTKGIDSSDVLVLPEGGSMDDIAFSARIGTSSPRREMAIKSLRSDLCCVDIRGSIELRLALLDSGVIDGLVVAEAALMRLQLTHRNRIKLGGETTPLQGKLAILARSNDEEMKQLFSCIHDPCMRNVSDERG